jgi:hypothetical protein
MVGTGIDGGNGGVQIVEFSLLCQQDGRLLEYIHTKHQISKQWIQKLQLFLPKLFGGLYSKIIKVWCPSKGNYRITEWAQFRISFASFG